MIANQAVITGAFSLARQAIQLGLLPRFSIKHTSESMAGQIYLPRVNYMLLGGVVIAVLLFRSSSHLASAYGISVTAAMVIDTIMAFFVVWKYWRWPVWKAAVIMIPLAAHRADVLRGQHPEALRRRMGAAGYRRPP